jgi:hypothetical protein
VPLEILLVVLAVATLVVAVPVRRLMLGGYSRWSILAYVGLIGLLAVGVTETRGAGRILLPVLGLAYIAPFLTLGRGLDRLLGRRRPVVRVSPVATPAIAPPRDVTPPVPGQDPGGSAEPPGPSDDAGPTA